MKSARLVPLVLLLLSAPVHAQDACLSGASTLGDQRAIRALRDATEAACPCAAVTRRGEYQRCARGVIAIERFVQEHHGETGSEHRHEIQHRPGAGQTLANYDDKIVAPYLSKIVTSLARTLAQNAASQPPLMSLPVLK